jgi:hypothetical protein
MNFACGLDIRCVRRNHPEHSALFSWEFTHIDDVIGFDADHSKRRSGLLRKSIGTAEEQATTRYDNRQLHKHPLPSKTGVQPTGEISIVLRRVGDETRLRFVSPQNLFARLSKNPIRRHESKGPSRSTLSTGTT